MTRIAEEEARVKARELRRAARAEEAMRGELATANAAIAALRHDAAAAASAAAEAAAAHDARLAAAETSAAALQGAVDAHEAEARRVAEQAAAREKAFAAEHDAKLELELKQQQLRYERRLQELELESRRRLSHSAGDAHAPTGGGGAPPAAAAQQQGLIAELLHRLVAGEGSPRRRPCVRDGDDDVAMVLGGARSATSVQQAVCQVVSDQVASALREITARDEQAHVRSRPREGQALARGRQNRCYSTQRRRSAGQKIACSAVRAMRPRLRLGSRHMLR